jgi:hypothetical protein
MPVRRRHDRRRIEIPPEVIDYFLERESDPPRESALEWCLEYDNDIALDALPSTYWSPAEEEVLEEWIETRPGTRPLCWWRWSAPRQPVGTYPGLYFDGQLCQPRLRLGGTGTLSSDVIAMVPRFERGLPLDWLHDRYCEHHACAPFDPEDPPIFESEAAYLDRLGLLLPGEKQRIKLAAFKPVRVTE